MYHNFRGYSAETGISVNIASYFWMKLKKQIEIQTYNFIKLLVCRRIIPYTGDVEMYSTRQDFLQKFFYKDTFFR